MTAMMPVCIVQNIAQPHRNPTAGEKRLAQKDVHAAGVRIRRRQLGGDQRAEQREDAGREPDREDAAHRRDRAGDDGRLHEDRRADDDADDERGGVELV